MGKLVWGFLLIWSGAWAENMVSYIVVAYGQEANTTQAAYVQLEHLFADDARLETLLQKNRARIEQVSFGNTSALRVGPFVPDERFAEIYLTLRMSFPGAVVIEQKAPLPDKTSSSQAVHAAPAVKTPPMQALPPVLPSHVSTDDTEEKTIWIALFGLALIGILYMFLSSDQLRRIKREHAQIEARQKALEIKQHTVLAQMGENIHTLAQETVNRTRSLAEKAEDGRIGEDVQHVIDGENELLGITGDLIKFLQIKAHKVTIQRAPFDINNVLHEIAGTLHNACRASDKELVFDVARDVPRQLEADSLHMAQVLTNLIEHLMCHTPSRVVRLGAHLRSDKQLGQRLEVTLYADADLPEEETLFDAHYDEATQKYLGLGLFVARELLELMGGALTLSSRETSATEMVLIFPVGERPAERRQYRLTDREIMGQRILIVDRNPDVLKALHRFLDYFKMDVTEMSAESFAAQVPDFSRYDIVVIDNTLLEATYRRRLEEIRERTPLQVISLENLYASETIPVEGVADVRMKKPLTQQHILDVLLQLAHPEAEHAVEAVPETSASDEKTPEVYRGDFANRTDVTLEDFGRFAGAHLLIVEDNLVNQKVLKGMLAKAGLTLSIANNGQEALERLDDVGKQVDMILMDISMPVMDGFTATQKIHAQERFRNIPIVTLTALASEHEVDKMFASGANGYLAKPLKIGKLYSAFARFLPETSQRPDSLSIAADEASSEEVGLETQEAIGNMQNNTLLYREVLNEFQEFYGNSDVVFEKLIQDMRYEQLRILCVDLRGLTGSIGAQQLHEVVSETLTMLLYRKYDLLERYISPYREELARLNGAIDAYLL